MISPLLHRFSLDQIQIHSGKIKSGDLFVALPGVGGHGVRYLGEALTRGASAVLTDQARPEMVPAPIAWIRSSTLGNDFVALVHAASGYVVKDMSLIAVTGTNGKSTIAHGLHYLLSTMGKAMGLFGTVEYRFREHSWPATHTTPDLLTFLRVMREMKTLNAEGAVLELSSHALDQKRLAGSRFKGAVLSNVTQDHLDYHGDMEKYYQAKAKLFTKEWLRDLAFAVVNSDDPYGKRLLASCEAKKVFRYGLHDEQADFRALSFQSTLSGTAARLGTPFGEIDFSTPLIGVHNLYNLLAIAAAGHALGLREKRIFEVLSSYSGLRGRLERATPPGHPFTVFVDYAHTPDALHHVLQSLKAVMTPKGRLWVVFGCGGNRDRGKRPLMGKEVFQFADRICLTSDNPRGEEPMAIIREILAGIPSGDHKSLLIEVDRRAAIVQCLAALEPGDLLLVAGKGHERYQIIGDRTIDFDDVAVVNDYV